MKHTSGMLLDSDLLFLIKILMPGTEKRQRMLRILREDEDILEAMLVDEKLFAVLSTDPHTLLRVSPQLFFIVLLNRVQKELKNRSFTVEKDFGTHALVFDSVAVTDFLDDRAIRNYLADMLFSFVRINSYTIPIRVRKGIWRKYRFSDYDIDSLMRYSEVLSKEHRFPSYKRMADICLFTRSIFQDSMRLLRIPDMVAEKGKGELEKYGKYLYRSASEYAELMELNSPAPGERQSLQDIAAVLLRLSEHFAMAVKPLTFMADHYLEPFKDELFAYQ